MKYFYFLSVLCGWVLTFFPLLTSAITIDITALVEGCDDGQISLGEQCDGVNLGGASCASLGFTGGVLTCSSACTYITSACTLNAPSSGGGGGGGGGGTLRNLSSIPDTNVVFSGTAYPSSRVYILKDGQLIVTTIANTLGDFIGTVSGLSSGTYTFGVYSEDRNKNKSNLFTFPIKISSGVTTKIGSIVIPPTLVPDKREVTYGGTLTVSGQSHPSSLITLELEGTKKETFITYSDQSGLYTLTIKTGARERGRYALRTRVSLTGLQSPFSQDVHVVIGDRDIPFFGIPQAGRRIDFNNDGRTNILDFSIAAYWYKRPSPPPIVDLNGNGIVDLGDFSILAFNWTG